MQINSQSCAPEMSRERVVIYLLFGITAAVFGRVGWHDFVLYDDPDYILNNPHVRAGLTWDGLKWAFLNVHGDATYWHPLTWLSHMLDVQLFGVKPGPHHLINVLFHATNACLLFLILKRMTGAFWASALVAALFALHPLQVDTVAWVTERKNVLSGLFWMLALEAYVHYAEKPALRRYWPVLLFFALGLLCKPVLVTFPFVLLLLDFWPLRRFQFSSQIHQIENGTVASPRFVPASSKRLLLEKLPLLAGALVSSWITVQAHSGLGISQSAFGLPLRLRLENGVVSYVRYLGKTFWPQKLAVLYPHPGEWPASVVLASALVLLAITAGAIWFWRRKPWLLVGWSWFLGVLIPMLGLLQAGVQAMADRFAYLPVIGLFIGLVWATAEITARWPKRFVPLTLLSGATLGAFVILTSLQLRYWQNSITLFSHALAVTEGNFVMENNLAYALNDKGRKAEALFHLAEALRMRPRYVEAHLQMAFILQEQGNLADAIAHFAAAAQLRPNQPFIRNNLATALGAAGRSDEAIQQYEEALRLQPDAAVSLNNLAWILATHPKAELRNGTKSVTLAERACTLTQRKEPMFLGTLAAAYAEAGRFDDAVAAGRLAMELATAAGATELAAKNKTLLELYQSHKPYRESAP